MLVFIIDFVLIESHSPLLCGVLLFVKAPGQSLFSCYWFIYKTISWLDEMELCVVLSNLLENAVENCHSKLDAPMIDVSIKKNKNQLCIRIQNNFDGKVWRLLWKSIMVS